MRGITKDYTQVQLYFPQSHDGAIASDIFSMKNWKQADIWITIGAVSQAAAVTLHKGASVSSAGTALAFTDYYCTGFVLDYDGASTETPAAAGETISGAGGGAGTIYKDTGTRLICYGYNATTFVDNETVTCSGGKTVVANGIQKNEDILIPRTASSNTFNIEAVADRRYCIPITSDMLGDGYDCVEVNIADANTTLYDIHVILMDARYISEIPETALYD